MNTSKPDSSTEQYQNEAGIIQWRQPGFWYLKFTEGDNISLDYFSELFVYASECRDYKVPVIVEREYSYSADLDVYKFAEELLPLYVNALAFVCYSPTSSNICEHICSSYLHAFPTKIFSQLDQAVAWVNEDYTKEPRIPAGI